MGCLIDPANHRFARFIIDRLDQRGFKACIVGGAVRDMILKRVPADVDGLTTASLKEIKALFSDQTVRQVGNTFPICLVSGIEVSSNRTRALVADFPESDLAGRDFTVNAMAYDPVADKIIDPFNGRRDLEDSVIRFNGDPEKRIHEDPVRMVRACRFAALLEGVISPSSLEAVLALRHLADQTIAKERIGHEIMRAMALEKPSLFFRALKKTRLLEKIFPSLDRCYDLDGGPHHKESVFDHCMLVGDALPPALTVLRLAGFLHDVGKFDAAAMKEGRLSFAGHETHTRAMVCDLTRLRFSVKDIAYIKALAASHMRPLTDQTTPKAARRLLAMLDAHGLDYRDFMRMRIADKKGNLAKRPYTLSEIRARLKKLFNEMNRPLALSHLAITGDDIVRIRGIRPGPEIGRIKQYLLEKVLDDPGLNTPDELKALCQSIQRPEQEIKDTGNE